ncbi:MAG TPA: hypothetical protein VJ860_05580 [Polyangia bacterium]|jgi:hypothetical protein|nr:hypothetical protein [Polyangia bacterium]
MEGLSVGEIAAITDTRISTVWVRLSRAHTATLLSNGQVLMAGGLGVDYQGLASAEL